MAGCHRLWCLNDFEHIIKEIPQEVISWRPEEPVDTNTVHTLYQGMRFICLHDDPRIKVIVIFNHAPLPNEISTFPSNCFCCHLLGCHVKSEMLCGEALTSQLLLRGTHATNFPVKDFSWSECDHLVGFHCGWHWWNLAWHLFHCLLNCFRCYIKQLNSCRCFS